MLIPVGTFMASNYTVSHKVGGSVIEPGGETNEHIDVGRLLASDSPRITSVSKIVFHIGHGLFRWDLWMLVKESLHSGCAYCIDY